MRKRIIKFRAWDTKYKTMFSVFDLDAHGYIMNQKWTNDNDNLNARCILMQFTGLHDANKREVYEGDIVKVFIQGMDFISTVLWGEKSHGWSLKCDRTNRERWGTVKYYSLPNPTKIEIIGNIYENPELIQ